MPAYIKYSKCFTGGVNNGIQDDSSTPDNKQTPPFPVQPWNRIPKDLQHDRDLGGSRGGWGTDTTN